MKELSEEAKIAVAYSQHALATVLAREVECYCGNPGKIPHPCPYKSEINEDDETLCNCCEDCIGNCSDDI